MFSLQSPFSGLSLEKYLASAEIPSVSLDLTFVVFISVLLQLVVSRFRFLLAERGAWWGSYMRGAWFFGPCLSQARRYMHKNRAGLSNGLLNDHLHFCALLYVFPTFCRDSLLTTEKFPLSPSLASVCVSPSSLVVSDTSSSLVPI